MQSQTPYQQPAAFQPQLTYASPLSRLVAVIIDGILLGIISSVLAKFLGPNIAGLAGVVIALLYFVLSKDQTLGKRVMKIRIVRASDATPISYGRAFGRYLGDIVDTLASFLLLLPCWMVLFSNRRRRFADLIAGTLVVEAR
jgi:uncharacterized RDD family membrane protein YckC